jgi:acyl dehydratase
MRSRNWNEAKIGDTLGPIHFPLSVYRLVVAASGVRDFNSIHHNSEYAQRTGAPEMYANTTFLLGMWERTVREYIGVAGSISRIRGFRMNSFNCAGDTVIVMGEVQEKWLEQGVGFLNVKVWTQNNDRISVGPGVVTVRLPLADGV